MPPGGTTSRLSERFSENVPRCGRHECLPYSYFPTFLKTYKHQFVVLLFCPAFFFLPYRTAASLLGKIVL